MTHLTSEEVDAVREIVKERIKEFDLQTLHTPSLGIVRLVIEAYELTRREHDPAWVERRLNDIRITADTAMEIREQGYQAGVEAARAAKAAELHTNGNHRDPHGELAEQWPAMPELAAGCRPLAAGTERDDPASSQQLAASSQLNHTPPDAEAAREAGRAFVAELSARAQARQAQPTIDADPHAAIYDLLRDLAADGIMPRQSEYDDAKADDMPSAGRLKQVIGLTWGQLAEKLGLTMLSPIERANLQRAEAAATEAPAVAPKLPRTLAEVDADAQAATPDTAPVAVADAGRQRRVELADKAFALLRGMAQGGQMPPISLYNERHEEAGLPSARLLLSALGLNDWGELAADVGLKWNKR